jgi:FkbM family methyltransferase
MISRVRNYFKLLKKRNEKKQRILFENKMNKLLNNLSNEDFLTSTKKKVFIDCGSNIGQGYDFFSKWFDIDNYDHILIEPNPYCIKILKNKLQKISNRIEILSKAADIENGEKKFYGLVEDGRGALSEGGSIVDFHNSAMYKPNEEEAIVVQTFDFSQFITDMKNKYERIVVKMDIEGAEYDILNKMIENESAKFISILFVEFHSDYMSGVLKNKFKKEEIRLIKQLNYLGCQTYIWR